MFSMPPASTTSASPRAMDCAACTIAHRPEPQARLIVHAGLVSGIPDRIATCRAGFGPRPACRAHPKIVRPTSEAGTPAFARSPDAIDVPSSTAERSDHCPRNLPIGVRKAWVMTARRMRVSGRPVGDHRPGSRN
jgi:hypothetical protein